MKIGDLVTFSEALTGLGDCLGIVIGFNGVGIVEVQWMDRHAARAVEITGDRANEMSSELAEFLEIVSENR